MGRLFAIGDIHGMLTPLEALLDWIKPGPGDTVVTLGDMVDRGPDSKGVLDLLMDLTDRGVVVPIKGNHDEMVLAARQGGWSEQAHWAHNGGLSTLKSFGVDDVQKVPEKYIRFIEERTLDFYETDSHFFVHGYYDPLFAVSDPRQNWERNRWRHLHDPEPHLSGKIAVVGHTPQRGGLPLRLPFLIDIDTGACFGGRLTAFEPAKNQYYQVNIKGERLSEI